MALSSTTLSERDVEELRKPKIQPYVAAILGSHAGQQLQNCTAKYLLGNPTSKFGNAAKKFGFYPKLLCMKPKTVLGCIIM